MNKVLVVISVILVFVLVALLNSHARQQKLVDIPPVVAMPTAIPTQAPLDFTKVKIEDVKKGKGAEAKEGSRVSVQYRGTLEDGTEFDSSYSRDKEPLVFTIGAGQMIPGFDYGVRGMRVGGTRKLTIPPELAYGASGSGPIPANATIRFEVVLEKVE
jgi:FKBP-type peptidyl-prolyl cis-trans isomerase